MSLLDSPEQFGPIVLDSRRRKPRFFGRRKAKNPGLPPPAITILLLLAVVPGCAPPPAAPADPTPATQPAGATAQQTADAIARGVAFLERDQRPDGSWGTGAISHGNEIYSMVPGSQISFRLGTTALCVMALREAGETEAHDKGLHYLLTSPDARRDDGTLLYNTWAHIYVTEAMAEEMLHADGKSIDPRIVEVANRNIKHLQQYATYIGGWAYYDFDDHTFQNAGSPTSFGTAAGLIALYEARQAGLATPARLVKLSLDSLERMREPTGVFMYGEYLRYYPLLPANLPPGAMGRTQPANYALWLWGHPRPTEKDILKGLNYFVVDHGVIEMGQGSGAARIVVPDFRVLLLFRPLLRLASARRPAEGSGREVCGTYPRLRRAASGAGWIVVGFCDVGFSQTLRHGLRRDDFAALPGGLGVTPAAPAEIEHPTPMAHSAAVSAAK